MLKHAALSIVGLIVVVIGVFSALIASNMMFDQSNPRARANSYYSELSVEVNRPIEEVYRFVKYEIPGIYTETSRMHQRFEILNANGLVEGARINCVEGISNEVAHHEYVVTKDIERRLIQLESPKSVVLNRDTERIIGESGAYVYFDFEELDDSRTRISQTIVLDMLNPVYKSLGDVVGFLSGNQKVWDQHFHEELENLAAYIERS